MLFNSLIFLIFASLFFLLWSFFQPKNHPRWIFLIVTSLIFYGWWDWRFIFLLIGCSLFNFYAAILIKNRQQHRKPILVAAIIGNVGVLALFKYLGFITSNLNALGLNLPIVRLALPIGISFYTFQGISYVMDVYKGIVPPTKNFFHFFAYLSIFPHLIAGPIIRASQLIPQLAEARKATDEELWAGCKLIVYGFFKKVVIADRLGVIVDLAFRQKYDVASGLYWWIIITFFAIQIYCDFAGYTDIARGLAKLMGYDFPINFNFPYFSKSIQEFWTRWHITLSNWLRDYIFYPLLQRKMTPLNAHISMVITMLVSGLWHGAGWTFIIWGGIHAFFFSIEQLTRWPKKFKRTGIGKGLSTIVTVIAVWIAWVFFRSYTIQQAVGILGKMFHSVLRTDFQIPKFTILVAIPLFIAVIMEFISFYKLNDKMKSWGSYKYIEIIAVALALVAVIYLRGKTQTFVYFQF